MQFTPLMILSLTALVSSSPLAQPDTQKITKRHPCKNVPRPEQPAGSCTYGRYDCNDNEIVLCDINKNWVFVATCGDLICSTWSQWPISRDPYCINYCEWDIARTVFADAARAPDLSMVDAQVPKV